MSAKLEAARAISDLAWLIAYHLSTSLGDQYRIQLIAEMYIHDLERLSTDQMLAKARECGLFEALRSQP